MAQRRATLTLAVVVALWATLAGLASPSVAQAITVLANQRLGDTQVGQVGSTVLTVRSEQNPETVQTVDVTQSGGEFSVTNDQCTGSTVATSCTVIIEFRPTAAGEQSAVVRIVGDFGGVDVSLTGLAFVVGPRLVATPTQVNFGELRPGAESPDVDLLVRNGGDRSTTVTTAFTAPNARLVVQDGCTRARLNPGGSCTMRLRFLAGLFNGPWGVRIVVSGDAGATGAEIQASGTVWSTYAASTSKDLGWILDGVSVLQRGRRLQLRVYSTRRVQIAGAIRRGARLIRSIRGSVRPGLTVITLRGGLDAGTYRVSIQARHNMEPRSDRLVLRVRR